MKFPLLILKKRLRKEQLIALTADRFAKQRVKELEKAIEILTKVNHE